MLAHEQTKHDKSSAVRCTNMAHSSQIYTKQSTVVSKPSKYFMGYIMHKHRIIQTSLHWNCDHFHKSMMTSSNGNIFRVTAPLCEEITGHRWIPLTKASDAELWCFLWSGINAWVNNREAGDFKCHRAHYDVIVMFSSLSASEVVKWQLLMQPMAKI